MDIKIDGTSVLATVAELGILIEEYDQADEASDLVPFAEHDPLKNLRRGLAEKLSSSSGKPFSECEQEAEEIIDQIKKELKKPNVKSRICAALKALSGDFSNLTVTTVAAVLVTLATGGVLILPVLHVLPEIVLAIGGFVLTRSGIEFVCQEDSADES